MFLNTLAAEFTKLRTTASFWWTTVLFVAISLGWAAMTGATVPVTEGIPTLWAASISMAVYAIGFPVLMIQAIMLVTTEYRYGVQSVTYLATPRRWTVALAKLLIYAAFAAGLTFLVVAGGFLLADALAPAVAAEQFHPWSDEEARMILWVYPAAAAMIVKISQGLALLLRQTAGSVALMLIWFMGLEQLFRLVPRIGSDIVRFLPFENLNAFTNGIALDGVPWGPYGSGAYFLAWALALWLFGVVVLQRRDA